MKLQKNTFLQIGIGTHILLFKTFFLHSDISFRFNLINFNFVFQHQVERSLSSMHVYNCVKAQRGNRMKLSELQVRSFFEIVSPKLELKFYDQLLVMLLQVLKSENHLKCNLICLHHKILAGLMNANKVQCVKLLCTQVYLEFLYFSVLEVIQNDLDRAPLVSVVCHSSECETDEQ